jgi:hypothetical protein
MSKTKSLFRRIACSVVLVLFAASVFAASLCAGHASHGGEPVGGCDGHVYATSTPPSDTLKQIDAPSRRLPLDMAASGAVAPLWPSAPDAHRPYTLSGAASAHRAHPFTVSARLRV